MNPPEPPPPPQPQPQQPADMELAQEFDEDIDRPQQPPPAAAADNNQEDHPNPNNGLPDGVIDGGIIGPNPDGKRTVDMDLLLSLECMDIPHMAAGSRVSIGMEKNCKLEAVYTLFLKFVNDRMAARVAAAKGDVVMQHKRGSGRNQHLNVRDIELVHMDVLNYSEVHNMTADQCALMKGDVLKVQLNRAEERARKAVWKRHQKELDVTYFRQLKSILVSPTNANGVCGGDVVFDCSQRDATGQKVLSTLVKAHSIILKKRCPYLWQKIQKARLMQRAAVSHNEFWHRNDASSVKVFTIEQDDIVSQNSQHEMDYSNSSDENVGKIRSRDDYHDNDNRNLKRICVREEASVRNIDSASSQSEMKNSLNEDKERSEVRSAEDDSASPQPAVRNEGDTNQRSQWYVANAASAKVEDDDDDVTSANNDIHVCKSKTSLSREVTNPRLSNSSPIFASESTQTLLRVPMKDYPPEAMKLLLEFCYTNRCDACGIEAFEVSSPDAVSIHGNNWPHYGEPQMSMSVALACITLGEEVGLQKFSLMCEVAASNLIHRGNVLEALSLCTSQKRKTGNRLAILRNKAAAFMLRKSVLDALKTDKNFLVSLNKKRENIIPALLHGTRDKVGAIKPKKEEHRISMSSKLKKWNFRENDADDRMKRALERAKWRNIRENAMEI